MLRWCSFRAKKAGRWLLSTCDSYHRPSWWRKGELVKEANNAPTHFLIVALPCPYSLLKHEHSNPTQLSNIVCILSIAALSTSRSFPSVEACEGAQCTHPQCHWYVFQIVNTPTHLDSPFLSLFIPSSWAWRIDGVNSPHWKSDHALLTPHSWTVTAVKWELCCSVPVRRSRASETQTPPSTPPRPLLLPLLSQFSTIPLPSLLHVRIETSAFLKRLTW